MNSLTKKLAAGVIAAATMFSIAGLGATTANAANASDGSIEVSSSNAEFKDKTVTAYQMFTYDKEAVENGTATNSGYVLISSWDDFFLHSVQVKGALVDNAGFEGIDFDVAVDNGLGGFKILVQQRVAGTVDRLAHAFDHVVEIIGNSLELLVENNAHVTCLSMLHIYLGSI